jgi:uncharacterized membrane protein
METIKLIGTSIVLFAAIDFVWLSTVAQRFYQSQIGSLLLKKPNIPAAVLFYLLFIVGLTIFVTKPAVNRHNDVVYALIYGALFGLFTYATYDLTNLATMKGWTVMLTAVDITWGIVLSALVAAGTVLVSRYL